jgi:hypothetical protein
MLCTWECLPTPDKSGFGGKKFQTKIVGTSDGGLFIPIQHKIENPLKHLEDL